MPDHGLRNACQCDYGLAFLYSSLAPRFERDRQPIRRPVDSWLATIKFRIQAVVIRSGTISQLERDLPSGDHSIFGYYPHIIVSIDYAKSDAHRANFLQHAPRFVIVDEAHGATAVASGGRGQQQRHELLRDLARDASRHLILLTATNKTDDGERVCKPGTLCRGDFSEAAWGC